MMDELAKWGWAIALAVNLLIGLVLWSMRNAFASRQDLQAVANRLVQVETRMEGVPSANALHELSNTVIRMSGDLKVMATRMDGVDRLVTRFEKVLDRQEDWLKKVS